MAVTKEQVLEALGRVAAPDGAPLPQAGVLSDIVAGDKVFFSITVDAAAVPAWEAVRKRAEEAVKAIAGVQSAMVALTAEHYPLVPPFLLRYPLRTDEAVAHIRSPLLLFHGDHDTLIAPHHSELLMALAPQAQRVRVPGAAHNDVHQFDSYLDALTGALAALH